MTDGRRPGRALLFTGEGGVGKTNDDDDETDDGDRVQRIPVS